MGNVANRQTPRNHRVRDGRKGVSTLGVVAVILALVVGAGLYNLVGTDRAVTACSADPPGRPASLAPAKKVGWSFIPPGFVCISLDESDEALGSTHLGLWP